MTSEKLARKERSIGPFTTLKEKLMTSSYNNGVSTRMDHWIGGGGDRRTFVDPMNAEQRNLQLEREALADRQAAIQDRMEYVEKLLGDADDRHAPWQQTHS